MESEQVKPGGGQPTGTSPSGEHAALLRRSRDDRVIAGICGGLGRYLGIDPVLIRVAWVALALAAGTGVLLYLVAWLVIPEEHAGEVVGSAPRTDVTTVRVVLGGVLVAIGALLLVNRFTTWFDWGLIWAVVLIAVGALVILRGASR
ncbi:MAG TPA: PspC domain-containing protein [Thermomicrobiaceae bacterium]|nr:PspC domain-containing protein [Thermomicrobiaceae bacterium]